MAIQLGTNTNAIHESFDAGTTPGPDLIAPLGLGNKDAYGLFLIFLTSTEGFDTVHLSEPGSNTIYLASIASNAYQDYAGIDEYLSIRGFSAARGDKVVFAESGYFPNYSTMFGYTYGSLGSDFGIGAEDRDFDGDGISDVVISEYPSVGNDPDIRFVFFSASTDDVEFTVPAYDFAETGIKVFPSGDFRSKIWSDLGSNGSNLDSLVAGYSDEVESEIEPPATSDFLTGVVTRRTLEEPATFETSELFDVTRRIAKRTRNGRKKKRSVTKSLDSGFLVGTDSTIDGVIKFDVYADFDQNGSFNRRKDRWIGWGKVEPEFVGLYESLDVGTQSWGVQFGTGFSIIYGDQVVAVGNHLL